GYEESLAIYRELRCKLRLASDYINMGGILLHLGDLPGARGNYEQALETYNEIGDQDGVALAKNGLGDVFQAMGRLMEASAKLVLSRALLAQGNMVEARESVERVRGVAKETHRRELELAATITAARIRATSGSAADRNEAAKRLNTVIGVATTAGFADVV